MTFKTMAEVRRANKALGNHWFDRASMRFFNSRIESKLYGGKYFITSEAMSIDSARKYSVRVVSPDGSISTSGEFHSFLYKSDAQNHVLYCQMGLTK